jgi:hypothetical protein
VTSIHPALRPGTLLRRDFVMLVCVWLCMGVCACGCGPGRTGVFPTLLAHLAWSSSLISKGMVARVFSALTLKDVLVVAASTEGRADGHVKFLRRVLEGARLFLCTGARAQH